MRTFKIIFTFLVGFSMISIWTMLFFSGSVPELHTEPLRILFHITAEIVTAVALIISGILILLINKNAPIFYLFSLGLLCYTLIASPGYYLDKGETGMVVMFAILFLITVFLLAKELKMTKD